MDRAKQQYPYTHTYSVCGRRKHDSKKIAIDYEMHVEMW